MAHRSQNSSLGDNNNPLHKDYLPPHYKEEYRLAIDALLENDTMGYHEFLQSADVVSFLAQPEIDYIREKVQVPTLTSSYPELTYQEGVNKDDSSSDTYWPMQSDVAAPGLDLGWPTVPVSAIGATEVTTLVNPSDPDMPSIKEQARRLIKNARQVIAIVMDMFTDVDIFADLLEAAARHIPVYVLLDEQDSHHFVSMVLSCKVNLDLIHMMRVRSVPGITYFTRSGKSFKGQVKDRFLLVDCRAVLSGNYSFMWSYEKIHRCIAHLFLGELVGSFDEEFRILYAQSEPLVIDQSLAVPDSGNYLSSQFGLMRSQSLRNPIGFRRQPELPSAFPYGDNLALPFRRNDPFRHTMDPGAGVTIGKYAQQQFRPQQSYIDQGRSIVSRAVEVSGSTFKRHSYAEGTQENYTSSRQYMKHRVMNNLDETDFHREHTQSSHYYSEGPGPGSGHGHYDRLRGFPSHVPMDQHSDSSYRSDRDLTLGNYGRPHYSSEDLTRPDGLSAPPVAGRYEGGHSYKRPTVGQPYTCQTSPTQPHAPAKKPFSHERSEPETDQDDNAKKGLRNYRISSYLSTYENHGEEGLNQPAGPDAFEDTPSQDPFAAEGTANVYGKRDHPTVPPKPRPDILKPRFGKPVQHDAISFDSSISKTTMDLLPSASILEKREKEAERERQREGTREVGVDVGVKDAPEVLLSKHESFRTRINPTLQRSSRLRSSLIFSSSKAEMHSGSLGMKPATEDDEEMDLGRTSSIVSQILEKRRSITREPYQWRKNAEERIQEAVQEKQEKSDEKDEKPLQNEAQLRDDMKTKMEYQKIKDEVKSVTSVKVAEEVVTPPAPNMNDPASRLQYFKDLAAKRKVTKTETDSKLKVTEPSETKQDVSREPLQTTTNPSVSNRSAEPEHNKPDLASKAADLPQKETSITSKPPLIPFKPQVSYLKTLEPIQIHKEENSSDSHKKETLFKTLKQLPSPKLFKKDTLKLKGLNPRRSCGEEILSGDATDAEKSEMKKIRSHSSSTLPREYSKEPKVMGSNSSINTAGNDGKSEGKTLDFLKKHTQKLKGILGKDKEKKSSGEDRSSVKEMVEEMNKKTISTKDAASASGEQTTANHKSSTTTSGPSRYQSQGSSVIFSSNLRDDTKVILEQISANSQKNRQEREEASADKDSDSGEKGLERQNSIKKSRFLRAPGNLQEREGLLKRIESLRKEKKVYSRFEMGNNLG